MIKFFGQFMKLPLEAFVYSMEMVVKTMRGIQQVAYLGIDMMTDGIVQTLVDAPVAEGDAATDVTDVTIGDSAETAQQMPEKEERKMADRDLRGDDELKLVRYKILFVKRDYEYAFKEQEELVYENIGESDYSGWKIAEFIQKLNEVDIPDLWLKKNFPRLATKGDKIKNLEEEDKKYLRVYFEVLDRYPREKFRHDEEQIKVLKDIRDRLGQKVGVEERQVAVLEQVRDGLVRSQGGGQARPVDPNVE